MQLLEVYDCRNAGYVLNFTHTLAKLLAVVGILIKELLEEKQISEKKDELITRLEKECQKMKSKQEDMSFELEKLSVENDILNRNNLSSGNSSNLQSIGVQTEYLNGEFQQCSFIDDEDQYNESGVQNRNVSSENLKFPVEVSERSDAEPINLSNKPSSLVTASVYNVYKLLLLTISHALLSSDIDRLKKWANETFSIQTNLSATDVILQLDKNGIIKASDLTQLRVFFEKNFRFDLVCLIDEFYKGEYTKLWKLADQNKSRRTNINQIYPPNLLSSQNNPPPFSPRRSTTVHRDERQIEELEPLRTADENYPLSIPNKNKEMESSDRSRKSTASSGIFTSHRNSGNGAAVSNTRGLRTFLFY